MALSLPVSADDLIPQAAPMCQIESLESWVDGRPRAGYGWMGRTYLPVPPALWERRRWWR